MLVIHISHISEKLMACCASDGSSRLAFSRVVGSSWLFIGLFWWASSNALSTRVIELKIDSGVFLLNMISCTLSAGACGILAVRTCIHDARNSRLKSFLLMRMVVEWIRPELTCRLTLVLNGEVAANLPGMMPSQNRPLLRTLFGQ